MCVAVSAPVKVTGVWQHGDVFLVSESMATLHFLGKYFHVDTAHSAGGTDKCNVHHFLIEPHDLKDLCALVGLQRRNTHFTHHLQHAFAYRFSVDRLNVCFRGNVADVTELSCTIGIPQRLERHVRVDGVNAIAHQQAMMMHFTCFSGLEHQTDL